MNKMRYKDTYHIRDNQKHIAKKYIYSRLITFGNDDFIERTIYIYIHIIHNEKRKKKIQKTCRQYQRKR